MLQPEYHEKIRQHLRTYYLLSDDRIDDVLPRFLETLESFMNNLERVFKTGKGEPLAKAGHALKGALLNLGLSELAEQAFAVEKHDQPQNAGIDIADHIAQLKKEISRIT
jgi:HPt (histidine-containing phosphotransfer) domain-containing protein